MDWFNISTMEPITFMTFRKNFDNNSNIALKLIQQLLDGKETVVTIETLGVDVIEKYEKYKFADYNPFCFMSNNKSIIFLDIITAFSLNWQQRLNHYFELMTKDQKINPLKIYYIVISKIDLCPEKKTYIHWGSIEDDNGNLKQDKFEYCLLNIQKFPKPVKKISDPIDQWVFFFNFGQCYDQKGFKKKVSCKEIVKAHENLLPQHWTKKDLDIYLSEVDNSMLLLNSFKLHEQESKEEAEKEVGMNSARNLLKFTNLPIEAIAEATKLCVDDIKKWCKK